MCLRGYDTGKCFFKRFQASVWLNANGFMVFENGSIEAMVSINDWPFCLMASHLWNTDIDSDGILPSCFHELGDFKSVDIGC